VDLRIDLEVSVSIAKRVAIPTELSIPARREESTDENISKIYSQKKLRKGT
jgi:hypothetical protein